ncbi:MAG: DUF58 domain-containing protein [Spirochaetales bacterium]|nr:DUF58 domain-containing protein [Spirochaetales bacterium]
MNLPFRFHKETLFLFLAGSVLFFLSSRYFGGVYIRLSRFWFVFFAADLLMLLINQLTIRYSLDFSRDHLSKGDTVRYTISMESSFFLPVPLIRMELAQLHSRTEEGDREIRLSLKPGERWVCSRDVHVTLRGVYTMGLSRLTLRSVSGLLSLDLPIHSRSFYVYPRVVDIPAVLKKHPSPGGKNAGLEGQKGDEHNFLGLREYREGEGLKHISWSRFMQTGRPCIKTYSSMGGSDIHIFLDRRASGRSPLCDDTALEVFLCIVRSGLATGQKMTLHGYPGWEGMSVETEAEFHRLFQSTLLFDFDAPDLEELRTLSTLEAVYAVSSMPDLALLDEKSRFSGLGHLICVSLSYSPSERERFTSLLLQRRQEGSVISEIDSDLSMEEELQCQLYS